MLLFVLLSVVVINSQFSEKITCPILCHPLDAPSLLLRLQRFVADQDPGGQWFERLRPRSFAMSSSGRDCFRDSPNPPFNVFHIFV